MIGHHSITRAQPHAFGAFTVRSELNSSASGATYLASDPSTDETVVVHTIEVPANRRQNDEGVVNTLRAMCTTKVRHPSFARPLASGVADGTPYLVYPHVAGVTLDALIRQRGPQPVGDVVGFLKPVASAIDAAALAGFHHGALTPSDILIGEDSVTVTRFGVVDALRHAGVTAPVERAYASRQRQACAPPTLADDVYSLAAIALEAIAGAAAERPSGVPLSGFEADILKTANNVDTAALHRTLSRALSENPSVRPSQASEFIRQLERARVEARPRPEPDAMPAVMMMFASEEAAAPPPPQEPVLFLSTEGPLQVPQQTVEGPLQTVLTSQAVAVPRGTGRRNLLIAAFVLIGIGAAFAAGMLTGQRTALLPVSQTDSPAAETTTAPETSRDAPPDHVTEAAPAPAQERQDEVSAAPVAAVPAPPAPPTPTPDTPSGTNRFVELSATSPAPSRAIVPPDTPGSLMANSYPAGARLVVDDVTIGTTPLLLPDLSVGMHRVRLELPDFKPWSASIDIKPDERYRLSVRLEQ